MLTVKNKYKASVRVYHTLYDGICGRFNRSKDYFTRHGWDKVGGGAGSEYYKDIKFSGYTVYRKSFEDIPTMESELKDIEAAFNDEDV